VLHASHAQGAGTRARRSIAPATVPPDAAGRVEWLVIAPHPDDAALMAGGVIARAVRGGAGVAVALMTNGDLTCAQDGEERETESVRGLADLGLDEQHVYFLGYPDGYLARLGHTPLPPVERRIGGRCVQGNETYALHGHDGRDVHSTWFGRSAAYTSDNAVADLSALLESLRPRQIVVTHPMDVHPDHAASYALLRRALARTGIQATVHRAMVHAGDCWPLGPEPSEPCPRTVIDPSAPLPPLFGALSGYAFNEHLPVPDDFLLPDPDANPKLRAIGEFRSQLGPVPLASYMFTFSRRDEAFFVESPEACEAAEAGCARHGGAPVGVILARSSPSQPVLQDLPLSVAFDWPKPQPAVEVLADADGAGSYRLAYDGDQGAAVLSRIERGASRAVKTWLLPHDLWQASDRERVELRFEGRAHDGDVAEIALRVRRELVGVAVDVHPRRTGRVVRASFDAGAGPLDLSVVSSAPAQAVRAPVENGGARRNGG
jgi:LmbE family N-acetylglucosaminyl deacetylase